MYQSNKQVKCNMMNQWQGKKVAFLGDSITDKNHIGTKKNYWQFLEEFLGIKAFVYGLNGWKWDGVKEQAEILYHELGNDIDAILIFMGTNDFDNGIPIGEWWNIQNEEVFSRGRTLTLPRRIFNTDVKTFRGRLNHGMSYLKDHFPEQQIILLTPIHRGFADFGGDNVQPEESFPNNSELFPEIYIEQLRQAGDIWSVPVIDLYRLSGLLPIRDAHSRYFHDEKTDRLHPNALGHRRIAQTLMYQMLSLPAGFR